MNVILKKIRSLSYKLSKNKEETWMEFDELMNEVDPLFLSKLLGKNPEIPLSSIRLAFMIKNQLTTKDIADLLDISPQQVKLLMHRLRGQLRQKDHTDLSYYLNKI